MKSKHLSVGQRRRLSIAEELVHGPSLLCVDEALAGLEHEETVLMMNVFRELVNQQRTVVITAFQVRQYAHLDSF